MTMDFQSAMETFAEAWVAANTKSAPLSDVNVQSQAMALTRGCRTPPSVSTPAAAGGSNRDSAERACTPAAPRSAASLDSVVSAPSIKDEFDHPKSTPGKSLPVHCVVEAVSTIDESRITNQGLWKRRPLIETDSYVIIPAATPFQGLVQAALLRLGYSADSAATARGSVILKNWKALSVDQISDDPLVTVGDILGELTAVATLRIQVIRSRSAVFADIKEKLLRFFLTQSQGLLVSAGCPIDEICRTNFGNDAPSTELSEECRRKFDQWWSAQFCPLSPSSRVPPVTSYTNLYPVSLHSSKSLDRPVPDPSHPAMQNVHSQFPTQKTRMRTSFDPELELPKLQRWFSDNQHPSRQQIQQYVKELNSLESRRGRKPLDVNNVVYWFKNARAAQKRAEIRNVTPALTCHMSVNGYNDHSPNNGSNLLMTDCYINSDPHLKNNLPTPYRRGFHTTRMSDELSNATSDLEEEDIIDSQPHSPIGPLSLTTTNKRDPKECSSRSVSPSHGIQVDSTKQEPKDEPTSYQSPSNHSHSNRMHMSDGEDGPNEDARNRINNRINHSPPDRSLSQAYCGSPEFERHLQNRAPNDGLERLTTGFPLVPNSMFSQSIMYMSHYIPGLSHAATSPNSSNVLGMSADERRKRNRTFIDPVTEVPRLEQWFSLNTHPSHNLILKYTEELNCMAYRQKFPRLEPKNVQFWFKNRRAKCKRLKMSLFDNQQSVHYHPADRE
ncbi:uncharacterized protein LOC116166246 isoform X2 [Photinus pyralis]|uniref:uncharacterized protein LOC116166246 isoform X2 n=1 Tax=Photinus pyralis TaxID=7054 RepID=UPI001266F6A6|nr:uncharacterized protein LOC116166246 isoform X2 [Photinus pyralis]